MWIGGRSRCRTGLAEVGIAAECELNSIIAHNLDPNLRDSLNVAPL